MTGEPLLTRDVDVAVARLCDGGLVGLPTETVYGLAADAEDPRAVARIYAVKGRPADHPLIVHVRDAGALRPGPDSWARDVPPYAHRLAEALWPGPLTLIVRRSARAGAHVTGGQDTVGLRSPAHPLAQAVIAGLAQARGREQAGVAAPSANRFGRVSPTTPQHVLDELSGLLVPGRDCVLDGGDCAVGVESTIVDCTGDAPRVLRPGAIGQGAIESVGGVAVLLPNRDGGGQPPVPRAPGTLAAHYAPAAEVLLAADGVAAAALTRSGEAGLIALAQVATPEGVVRLTAPDDVQGYARGLYAALREADALGLRRVVAVLPRLADGPGQGLEQSVDLSIDRGVDRGVDQGDPAAELIAAVTDRLLRAAAGSRPPLDADTL